MLKIRQLSGLALAALIGVSTLGAANADAQTLRYAMGFPPGSDSDVAGKKYAEAVSELTNGEINVRVFALSLLNFAETSGGVRDGIADLGYVLTPYFPQQFPHMNLVAEASMALHLADEKVRGREGYAYVGAMAEFVFLNCPECHEEMEKQNQVMTSNAGSTQYGLTCRKEIRTAEDLRGTRMRVAGSHWSRWAQEFGASPVTLSSNEAAEALSQGVVDCVVISAPELTNLGLFEHVTDITMAIPGGIFAGTATANMNRDKWQALSVEHRRAMLKAGSILAAEIPFIYHSREAAVLERIQSERGARLHEPAPELLAAVEAFVEKDLRNMADYYQKERGVARSHEMLETFLQILDRWAGLVQDVETAEDLSDLYWEEVYSKVDVTTHGM